MDCTLVVNISFPAHFRFARFFRAMAYRVCGAMLLCMVVMPAAGCRSSTSVSESGPMGLPAMRPLIGSSQRQEWREWGDQRLQSGDIVFVRGDSRILFGLVNFSKLSTDLAGSRYSHVGIVAREGDELVVYDTISGGPRRVAFDKFVTDRRVWTFAVKRPRLEWQPYVPQALEFCRGVYRERRSFDSDFRLDNDRLYCSELVELAFREAGMEISEPVRIDCLPGFDDMSPTLISLVAAATAIRTDQEVFVPGNESIGLWSSPRLELVLDETDTANAPESSSPSSVASRPAKR
jgi:hypothetical protein